MVLGLQDLSVARQTVMEAAAGLGVFSRAQQEAQGTQVHRVLLVAPVLQVLVRPVVLQEARVALAPTVTQEIQGQQEQALQLVALVALALQGQMVTQEIQALPEQAPHLAALVALAQQAPQVM